MKQGWVPLPWERCLTWSRAVLAWRLALSASASLSHRLVRQGSNLWWRACSVFCSAGPETGNAISGDG